MPWPDSLPWRGWERLKAEYPGDPRQQLVRTVFQFPNADVTRLVSIGDRSVTVHALPPYEGWNDLEHRARRVQEALGDIMPAAAVSRVSVRYINRLPIPLPPIGGKSFPEYVTLAPPLPRSSHGIVPSTLPSTVTDFQGKVSGRYPDGTEFTLNHGMERVVQLHVWFLLDMEFTRRFSASANLTLAFAAAAELHDRAIAAFETLVTEEGRRLFE